MGEKILTKDLEKIKEELISIFKMPKDKRKNISREKQKLTHTIFESMNGLDFDYSPINEEDVLVDSRSFEGGGIKY